MTTTKETFTLPRVSEVIALLRELQGEIDDDYRASEEDTEPGMSITIGADPSGDWDYQTGDNSYTGNAYGYRIWGVGTLLQADDDDAIRWLAEDLVSQIGDQVCDTYDVIDPEPDDTDDEPITDDNGGKDWEAYPEVKRPDPEGEAPPCPRLAVRGKIEHDAEPCPFCTDDDS